MIRLIHQFDDHRTRPMAASPKSEMCSCCCSCSVVTIVGAGVLTARSVGRARLARAPGPDAPSGVDDPYRAAVAPARPRLKRVGARVFGFFLLPIAIMLGGFVATIDPAMGVAVGVLAYIGGLGYLVAKAALPGWAFALVVLVPAVAAGEAYVWIITFFN